MPFLLTSRRVLQAPLVFRALGLLPGSMIYRLAASVGWLERNTVDRRRSRQERQRIMPIIARFDLPGRDRQESSSLARKSVEYFYQRRAAELLLLLLSLQSRRRLERIVDTSALAEIVQHADQERGIVLATLHIGPYGMLPAVLAALGFPVSGTAVTEQLDVVHTVGRQYAPDLLAQGHSFAVEDKAVLLRAARDLEQRRLVCVYPEFPMLARVPTVDVSLFEATVKAPMGAAALAAKRKAEIVPMALGSLGNGRFEIVRGNSLMAEASDRAEMQRLTRLLFKEIERIVGRFPEQWRGWEYYAQFPQHGPMRDS